MGQMFSSEEELSQVKDAVGSVLYQAMLEGGAVPDLGVVHPRLLVNRGESLDSRVSLQEQLQRLQGDIGSRAPTYLRDLIGRLTTFSDEPRLAGLVGLVVTMVMDMVYTSSKRSSGVTGKSAGLSSCQQRVWELQEVMEEYLKRCRINLNDKSKLIQDSVRLEAQFSLTLTQLKTCMLGGDCDSRRYKSNTVCAVKCRGGLPASYDPSDEVPEEGSMTGLTVTDRETGKSVTIPLSTLETETGRRWRVSEPDDTSVSSFINLNLITSDQYAQAYLEYLFSDKGPVAELENYYNRATDNLRTLRTLPGCTKKTEVRDGAEQSDGVHLKERAEGINGEQRDNRSKGGKQNEMERRGREEEKEECSQRDESLKLSVVETQP